MQHPDFRRHHRLLQAAACALALCGAAPAALANPWPDKPVTLVVPYSAGGPTDVVARLLAVPMGQSLGQTVVVENTVGAGGTLAPARVARAKPDGYTILIHHMGMATAMALYKKLPYDSLKDFEYVGQVLDVPMTLLSRKDFPPNTLPELLDYVKKNQDKVSLANAGTGAVSQLCGMLFMHQVGVKLTTVPYKGAGPAMNDLMGGQVDLLCVKVWHGMYAPKGTPKEVVMAINKALNAALKDETVKKRITELSSDLATPEKATPEGLRKHLEAEVARWGKVIRSAGLSAE